MERTMESTVRKCSGDVVDVYEAAGGSIADMLRALAYAVEDATPGCSGLMATTHWDEDTQRMLLVAHLTS